MIISYHDPFVSRLVDDIGALVQGDADKRASVRERLLVLAERNAPPVAAYWARTERGRGIPDSAYKRESPYLFGDAAPARTFRTSGTSGAATGTSQFSQHGLALMDLSVLTNARRHLIGALDRPAIVRLVPSEAAAPHMIMAHGMELIANTFGDPSCSASVIGPGGVDYPRLAELMDRAVADQRPAILIGGSFAFVNVFEQLLAQGNSWQLPAGSRVVDAGGFKIQSRVVNVDELRSMAARCLGVDASCCVNIFGMTELSSQLYDASDTPLGPLRERPKGRLPYVEPRVRDPRTMRVREHGLGLLEVEDLCILDRPHTLLTGDLGIACSEGVAVVGRIMRGQARGCSLVLDAITATGVARA